MKAEHRHELQTNALADHLGRLLEGVRKNPTVSFASMGVIAGVAAIVLVAWYLISVRSDLSATWVRIDEASDPQTFTRIAQESQGTLAGRTARFQAARLMLQEGARGLYSPERNKAIQQLQEARKSFEELVGISKDEPLLAQQAMMGAAKAEESLAGVAKEGDASAMAGSLDKAKEWYRQLADTYPDSFLGQRAAAHLKELETKGPEVARFYTDLEKLADNKSR